MRQIPHHICCYSCQCCTAATEGGRGEGGRKRCAQTSMCSGIRRILNLVSVEGDLYLSSSQHLCTARHAHRSAYAGRGWKHRRQEGVRWEKEQEVCCSDKYLFRNQAYPQLGFGRGRPVLVISATPCMDEGAIQEHRRAAAKPRGRLLLIGTEARAA
jgi:hypothetical protein